MTPTAIDERLTLADAARKIREAVKDRSYRATPLGLDTADLEAALISIYRLGED